MIAGLILSDPAPRLLVWFFHGSIAIEAGVIDAALKLVDADCVPAIFQRSLAVPPINETISQIEARIATTKIIQADLVNFRMLIYEGYKSFQILAPISVGVGDVVVAIFWSASYNFV